MKDLQFLTITTKYGCFDLPKDMPIPQKGDNVFLESETAVVDYTNYHISKDGKLHMISIFAETD
tara:strand:- start:82 stop:273 length:192 start_codon:yes stop_codon:yes gene_type:complete